MIDVPTYSFQSGCDQMTAHVSPNGTVSFNGRGPRGGWIYGPGRLTREQLLELAKLAGIIPAATLDADRDGNEEAYFAEIVDDQGDRHWSDLIFGAPNDREALASAQDFADGAGERYGGDRCLQVRGPFIIPGIPACGMIG